jgi:iron complex transport system substrate-binding protein
MKVVRFPLAALVCLSLAAASCGSGENDGASGAPRTASVVADDFPVTVAAANGTVRVDERPEAIVSLSPTATEILFEVGAEDQVVAVDDQSNYPSEAPTSELSGFEPNVEAIASYEPDLVVLSDDLGGVVKSLDKIAIPVIHQPAAADLNDTYEQIEQLGTATGHVDGSEDLVASMRADIEEIVASVPDFDTAPTFFHELDDTYFTANSDTFIGQAYSLLGLENIADEAKGATAGYVQLSQEYIIDADPDLIFLADTKCCNQNDATVAKRPGWNQIAAVQEGGVVGMDDDIASRWGPRIVDFLRRAAEAVAELDQG